MAHEANSDVAMARGAVVEDPVQEREPRDYAPTSVQDASEADGVGLAVQEEGRVVEELVDHFDFLASIPRGEKRFNRNNPQAPSCVYRRNGGCLYVGGFLAAEDARWLERSGVGLVVTVLSPKQSAPSLPAGPRTHAPTADRIGGPGGTAIAASIRLTS